MSDRNSTTARAVAYYRMSTTGQEKSISQQCEWARRAAGKERVEIVREFEDPGIPGSDIDQRPGLQEMLRFCEDRAHCGYPVGTLVVWDMDRLSRASSIRTAAVIDSLMAAGVTRMLTSEGWTDFGNELDCVLLNLRQDLSKAAFSKAISKNVTRAAIERARRGEWCGSSTPYAYVRGPDGRLAPGDPVRVAVVRWLFQTYAEYGGSLLTLAQQLEAEGKPRPREGKPWSRSGVWGILTNERYTGRAVWNTTHRGKYHRAHEGSVAASDFAAREGRRRAQGLKHLATEKNNPEDFFVVENAHEALVSRELFDLVQERLREARGWTSPRGPKTEWALSGLIFCAGCGAPMWGTVLTPKEGRYRYPIYHCSTVRNYGAKGSGERRCRPNTVGRDDILDAVIRRLQEHLLDPKALARLRKELARKTKERAGDVEAARQRLRDRIGALDKQVAQGTKNLALLPADLIEDVVKDVRAWKDERQQAARELANLEPGEAVRPGDVEALLALVGQLQEIARRAPASRVRAALLPLVKSVRVHFKSDAQQKKQGRKKVPFDETRLEVELSPLFCGLLSPARPN
jgi:DNA invertase Pin-like site-specific DNA recombinase